jgi:hypothetical protein
MQTSTKWTTKVTQPAHAHHAGQSFHKSHTSLGATGHWLREAGILAPLLITEFVKDNDKRWRYIRFASIGTALLSEGLHTYQVHRHREESRAREEAGCAL